MKNRRHSARKLPFLMASALALSAAPVALAQGPAPLKVITSGGFSAAFRQLQPEFEKASGIKVALSRGASQGAGPETIGAQLRRGVPADVGTSKTVASSLGSSEAGTS